MKFLTTCLSFFEAQAQLNQLSAQWQEEIENKYEAVRLLEESYKAEKSASYQ